MTPALVIGTPRSRTAWLAAYLSTPTRKFLHDPSADWSSLDDLRRFLNEHDAAACDTLLALFWRQIVDIRPDVRLVVVRRPIAEVFASCARAGFPSLDDLAKQFLARLAAEADAAARYPGVMRVTFGGLRSDATCAAVYRFVHGVTPAPSYVWHWQAQNVQAPWRDAGAHTRNLLAELARAA